MVTGSAAEVVAMVTVIVAGAVATLMAEAAKPVTRVTASAVIAIVTRFT